jgi:hypothetical protein
MGRTQNGSHFRKRHSFRSDLVRKQFLKQTHLWHGTQAETANTSKNQCFRGVLDWKVSSNDQEFVLAQVLHGH